jgi:hypothetical protein
MKIPYLYGCLVVVEWVGLSPKKVGEWDTLMIGKGFIKIKCVVFKRNDINNTHCSFNVYILIYSLLKFHY